MKVIFENVDLSPLTPYGRKYLGYPIDKGKLFLNLKYHIEKQETGRAEIVVLLDQFTSANLESPDRAEASRPARHRASEGPAGKDRSRHSSHGTDGRPQFSIGPPRSQGSRKPDRQGRHPPPSPFSGPFSAAGGEDLVSWAFTPGAVQVDEEGRKKIDVLAKGPLRPDASETGDPRDTPIPQRTGRPFGRPGWKSGSGRLK